MGIERWTKEDKPLRIMRVEMVPISMVKPHEAIIEEEVKDFIKSLKSKGIFFRPILLDKENYVVLDGHHRVEGLKRLGAKTVPAIFLDYTDDEIKLYTWYPFVLASRKDVKKVVGGVCKLECVDLKKGKELVDSGKADICLLFSSSKSSMVAFGDIEEVIREINNNFTLEYVDTLDILKTFDKDRGVVFYRKAPTKEEVLAIAKEGRVFPPKTTRHYLPYRYQNIRVKLTYLM
ncbi:MAG: ParB N-terminal domain-containing protein [Candidatus Methanofastidiosia archaeon]